MKVKLRFGKEGLDVNVPDYKTLPSGDRKVYPVDKNVQVLQLKSVPGLKEPEKAIQHALDSPFGKPPLKEIARGRKNACIVVSDITRPVPNKVILPPILATLEDAGIPKERIIILIATGLHRPNMDKELEELVGSKTAAGYNVVNHYAKKDEDHAFVGNTGKGTPVFIDRRYVEADLKILTGLIEPHLMAGYSGGAKAICPGCASVKTVRVIHSPRFLESENATVGVIKGNPLREEILEVAQKTGVDFIVNVTLNEKREIIGVFAGDFRAAQLEGIKQVEKTAKVRLDKAPDIILTTGAGYPLDLTFYQSSKGLVGAYAAVKPGGTIILAAQMEEGLGSPDFERALDEAKDLDAFMKKLWSDDFFIIDQWSMEEVVKVLKKAEVLCYSDKLSPDRIRLCHMKPLKSVEEGLTLAFNKHGKDASLLVIPEGPYLILYV